MLFCGSRTGTRGTRTWFIFVVPILVTLITFSWVTASAVSTLSSTKAVDRLRRFAGGASVEAMIEVRACDTTRFAWGGIEWLPASGWDSALASIPRGFREARATPYVPRIARLCDYHRCIPHSPLLSWMPPKILTRNYVKTASTMPKNCSKFFRSKVVSSKQQLFRNEFSSWEAKYYQQCSITGPKMESSRKMKKKVNYGQRWNRHTVINRHIMWISYQGLTVWCSNNWRMERGVARKSNNFRPKRTDVIWHTRQQDVMEEIGKILHVDEATMETNGWFLARMPAIKNIIDRMSPDELTALDAQVELFAQKGYEEKHQRRWVTTLYPRRCRCRCRFKSSGLLKNIMWNEFIKRCRTSTRKWEWPHLSLCVIQGQMENWPLMRTSSTHWVAGCHMPTYPSQIWPHCRTHECPIPKCLGYLPRRCQKYEIDSPDLYESFENEAKSSRFTFRHRQRWPAAKAGIGQDN